MPLPPRETPFTRGGLIGGNINSGNKETTPKGFEFLSNVGDHLDPVRSRFGSVPLDERGGVDDVIILRHLAPLRAARAWVPSESPAGVTDVRIHRLMASGRDAMVEFRGQ